MASLANNQQGLGLRGLILEEAYPVVPDLL